MKFWLKWLLTVVFVSAMTVFVPPIFLSSKVCCVAVWVMLGAIAIFGLVRRLK